MNFPRIISPVTEIRWAGWRSDTLHLQRAGWEISACQDVYRNGYRFAIKHPVYKMYGISQTIEDFHYQQYFSSPSQYPFPPIEIRKMASNMKVQIYDDLSQFQPIDAEPFLCNKEIRDIEDFKIFKTIGNCQEIIVPDKSVSDILNEILAKQAPYQKELREKQRREYKKFQHELNAMTEEYLKDCDPRKNIVAQIITV